jgi:hypothetical protein
MFIFTSVRPSNASLCAQDRQAVWTISHCELAYFYSNICVRLFHELSDIYKRLKDGSSGGIISFTNNFMGWVFLENLITQLDKTPPLFNETQRLINTFTEDIVPRYFSSDHNYTSHSSLGTLHSIARGRLLASQAVKKLHSNHCVCKSPIPSSQHFF